MSRNVEMFYVPSGYQLIGRCVENQSVSHGTQPYRSAMFDVLSAMKQSVTNAMKAKSRQQSKSATMNSAKAYGALTSGQR